VCEVGDVAFDESTTLEKVTKGFSSLAREFTNDTSICRGYFSSIRKFSNDTSICRTFFLSAHKFMEITTTSLGKEGLPSSKNHKDQ
jgi:hypothetical protein